MTISGGTDNFDRWKPKDKLDYLTLAELAKKVGKTREWLKALDQRGGLPTPIRYKVGKHRVRLYSPEQVEQIVLRFQELEAKRKKNRRDPVKAKHRRYVAEWRKRKREEASA